MNEIEVTFNGAVTRVSYKKIKKLLTNDKLFSGTIQHIQDKSIYVFNGLDNLQLEQILSEIKKDVGLSEVKIEIQTNDADAKKIQQKSIKKYLI
jgi:acylphosphatase